MTPQDALKLLVQEIYAPRYGDLELAVARVGHSHWALSAHTPGRQHIRLLDTFLAEAPSFVDYKGRRAYVDAVDELVMAFVAEVKADGNGAAS